MLAAIAQSSPAQTEALTVPPPAKIAAKRGETATVVLPVKVRPGYHVNSNTPLEEYLIPMRLTWDAKPVEEYSVVFPKPAMEKYAFSEKPLSVFTHDFSIETHLKVPASATPGLIMALGKFRYQACTDKLCLPPKTVEIRLPIEIR